MIKTLRILTTLCVIHCDSVAAQQTLNPIPLTRPSEETQVAVVKWAAFGSGCRAVAEQKAPERDVTLTIKPQNALHLPQLNLTLLFAKYGLASGRALEQAQELYSECALRFAIRGQPGRRVKRIEGRARVSLRKEKGASLLLVNELRFGQFGGAMKRLDYDEQADVRNPVMDLNLSKDLDAVRSDGKTSCGSDQVLFYDFTIFARKRVPASEVQVNFPAPQRARIQLDYESCSE